ncbi:Fpg/Nei family DNA glycosylase [Arthrobacter russicus]|jgi:formamidopyrimidine-DNA glycosylase|uniref:DNA-(apurinic or apyrimidinic site) lyase n=1 Tax=Arthrobacter russicus TaxID=172040 RepID=A0ABU1J6U9_9MICC|nr:DNA-formamidopyrimidine glycosylase family protein [Arthrobacter russicus]MDR6268149.1 endonuclease-8/formamidopyrimidine-DNA glycosylase [Arthrobacter russicus]
MPEGHTIHRLARQFNDVFGNARLTASSPQGRFADGAARIDGQILTGAQAHGKQLFAAFESGVILRVHLGLYGAWDFGGDETFRGASSIGAPRRVGERELGSEEVSYTGPPEPIGAVRLRLVSAHGWADLRGPSACEVLTPTEAAAIRAKLGPDPLNAARSDDGAVEFLQRIRSSARPVAVLLMDQNIVAGIGNVYRAELLFRNRIDPMLSGKQLSVEQVSMLWADAVVLLEEGVAKGRIITTELANRDRPDDVHYVYRRTGLACLICGEAVFGKELAGRNLFYCPGCQCQVRHLPD